MPDPSLSTLTVLNSNFLQLGRRSGGRPQRTVTCQHCDTHYVCRHRTHNLPISPTRYRDQCFYYTSNVKTPSMYTTSLTVNSPLPVRCCCRFCRNPTWISSAVVDRDPLSQSIDSGRALPLTSGQTFCQRRVFRTYM